MYNMNLNYTMQATSEFSRLLLTQLHRLFVCCLEYSLNSAACFGGSLLSLGVIDKKKNKFKCTFLNCTGLVL